jgi:hypothetical protein
MQSSALSTQPSKAIVWTGRVFTALSTLFMIFDGVIHVAKPAVVTQAFAALGVPAELSVTIGVIELACVALLLVRQTSFLGALLLTAYLGGATAIQVRAGAGAFPVLFPAIIATLMWGGLLLRDSRIRSLVVGRE